MSPDLTWPVNVLYTLDVGVISHRMIRYLIREHPESAASLIH